jgi:hypothetical protein
VRTEIIEITPSQAKEWLQTKNANRNISPAHVSYLVNEIKSGRWRLTHQGIAFNEDGFLIDGQHRLEAIAKSGISIKMMVSHGVPTDRFPIFDRGMPRNISFITGIPPFAAQIYSLFLAVATGFLRQSPDDMIILHRYFEPFTKKLQASTNTAVPYFSSAPIRAGAIMSMHKGEDTNYVLSTYRKLVIQSPSDLQTLSPVALSLIKQFTRATKEERHSFTGHYAREQLYAKSRQIFTKANSQHVQLHVEGDYIQSCLLELKVDITKILVDAQPELQKDILQKEIAKKDQRIREIQTQLMKERATNIDETNYVLGKEARG